MSCNVQRNTVRLYTCGEKNGEKTILSFKEQITSRSVRIKVAKWKNAVDKQPVTAVMEALVQENNNTAQTAVYTESPKQFNIEMLQNNLENCLSIIDNVVMKNYLPTLQNCEVVPIADEKIAELAQIQFFRISELVYQENEFSVHKLATVFNALSGKPCTLALVIRSDGQSSNFYLGVRSEDQRFSGGTMRQLLEQSIVGLFPGSATEPYYNEAMRNDFDTLNIKAVSSVTCIADYKQHDKVSENRNFIQGLEKLVGSMQGKAFTAVCIANNLKHQDLLKNRKEYERIYTLISPFANMQYNYALNKSTSNSDSEARGNGKIDSIGRNKGKNVQRSRSDAESCGKQKTYTTNKTHGQSKAAGHSTSHTIGRTDSIADSETVTKNDGHYSGSGLNFWGVQANVGVTSSVSRGRTHSTSHTDSISDSISQSLTYGMTTSESTGQTEGESSSSMQTQTTGYGVQYSENEGHSVSTNYTHTKVFADTLGSSQAVTLNVQNKALIDTLARLDKQLKRLDECESIGMWDFAAYFLGESAAESETAASMYRSLVSGNQSGVEMAAVNTWTDTRRVNSIAKYVINFVHPVFLYECGDNMLKKQTLVDATALSSTNELAIQLGLPRKSVQGLPVTEHATFAQEVLSKNRKNTGKEKIYLGKVDWFGADTGGKVYLNLNQLTSHTFITGSTGAGKSNTVYHLLDELDRQNVNFLVIEPAKGEYKNVFGGRKNVSVYGTNAKKAPLLRLNPFSFPEDTHVLEHIDRLVEIFNACWPMYAAMPAVLKDAVEQAYVKCGWSLTNSTNAANTFPTFADLKEALPTVVQKSQYSADTQSDYIGALVTRVKSLTNGINGQIFCSNDEIPAEKLFDENVIVDLSRVGSMETKSLLMGVLVLKLQEHRMAGGDMNADLRHVTVLEEAHNLLRRTSDMQTQESSNLQGKSVEMIANAIAEMRTYGEGFIIADQAPGLMDPAVIRNTNTKIIMRLPDEGDRELVGKAASLNDDQIVELAKLPLGVAAVYQNDWLEPVLCKINRFEDGVAFDYQGPDETQPVNSRFFQWLLNDKAKWEPLNSEDVDWIHNWITKLHIGTDARKILLNALNTREHPDSQKLRFALYAAVGGKHIIATALKFDEVSEQRAYLNQQIREILRITEEQSDCVRNQLYWYIHNCQKENIRDRENIELRKALM